MSSDGDDYAFGYDPARHAAPPLSDVRVREIVREELALHGVAITGDAASLETGISERFSVYLRDLDTYLGDLCRRLRADGGGR